MKGTRLLASNRNLKVLLLGLVALGATGLALAGYATRTLRTLDLGTVNTRFSIRGSDKPPSNIVVVAIDDTSITAINKQWPFPRADQARLLNHIGAGHPAAVAFDVVFSDPSQLGQKDDLALLNALGDNNINGRVVLSFQETDAKGDVRLFGLGQTQEALRQAGVEPGITLFPVDPGSYIRRMSYTINEVPTFPVVTAETATGKRVRPFTGSKWIDYRGPAGRFHTVTFQDVYDGKIPASFFRGKIVVIGPTASDLHDVHPTSTDAQMSGAEVEANAIDTVLRGFPLSTVPGWVNVVLIVLFGVAVPLAALRFRPIVSIAVAVLIGLAFAVVAQLLFNAGAIVSFVYPMLALVLSAIGSLAVQLVTEAFERIRTRELFSRFVPENVVDEVLKGAHGLRLGGVQREGTVMFTDLRGFTSFSEKLTPAQVIEVLNHYLSEMSDAILDNGGTLVAYMGDGIFAVFGAPLEAPDHADRALRTAREMLEVRLPRFNNWIRSQGLGDGFRMGIGLNSGYVMSGHVGSERRVEYAAVGDTTNTASRIEALTKGTPHQLLLSDSTREALREPANDLVYVAEVEIRGRVARMKLWGLNEAPPPAAAAAQAPTDAIPAG
ncbi:MAG: adenylate/guanylate cyclase domain-containing protein [Solirubrobacterales bacterium]|nr:adenylate/guanylate cyclase domain-containing protein [Solirubrobacterales bacterium]